MRLKKASSILQYYENNFDLMDFEKVWEIPRSHWTIFWEPLPYMLLPSLQNFLKPELGNWKFLLLSLHMTFMQAKEESRESMTGNLYSIFFSKVVYLFFNWTISHPTQINILLLVWIFTPLVVSPLPHLDEIHTHKQIFGKEKEFGWTKQESLSYAQDIST